ncbi:MAG: DUF559 domain-containing protein [Balneolaceae bacterium]|nr:DUF559 domain-containing protein [Balneolaceae bacterium]
MCIKKQNNMNFFIADFYCTKKLVGELGGKVHDYQNDYDRKRDLILIKKRPGLDNEECAELEGAKQKILETRK